MIENIKSFSTSSLKQQTIKIPFTNIGLRKYYDFATSHNFHFVLKIYPKHSHCKPVVQGTNSPLYTNGSSFINRCITVSTYFSPNQACTQNLSLQGPKVSVPQYKKVLLQHSKSSTVPTADSIYSKFDSKIKFIFPSQFFLV